MRDAGGCCALCSPLHHASRTRNPKGTLEFTAGVPTSAAHLELLEALCREPLYASHYCEGTNPNPIHHLVAYPLTLLC
jgi:hypothetical protein